MIMTAYDWYRIAIDVITIAIIPAGIMVTRLLRTIKTNDLLHIDAKLSDIKGISERTEEKLDRHIEWHLSQKG